MMQVLRALLNWLRAVSGDNAYEQYRLHHARVHGAERPPYTREEFYEAELRRKWSGVNRCC